MQKKTRPYTLPSVVGPSGISSTLLETLKDPKGVEIKDSKNLNSSLHSAFIALFTILSYLISVVVVSLLVREKDFSAEFR